MARIQFSPFVLSFYGPNWNRDACGVRYRHVRLNCSLNFSLPVNRFCKWSLNPDFQERIICDSYGNCAMEKSWQALGKTRSSKKSKTGRKSKSKQSNEFQSASVKAGFHGHHSVWNGPSYFWTLPLSTHFTDKMSSKCSTCDVLGKGVETFQNKFLRESSVWTFESTQVYSNSMPSNKICISHFLLIAPLLRNAKVKTKGSIEFNVSWILYLAWLPLWIIAWIIASTKINEFLQTVICSVFLSGWGSKCRF